MVLALVISDGWGPDSAWGQPKTLAVLEAELQSPDVGTRILAARALGRRGIHSADAIPSIIGALDDTDGGVRATSAWALEQIASGSAMVVPALERALGDPEPSVRSAAAYAMGVFFLKTDIVVPALSRHYDDEDESVRGAIASSLSRMGAPAVPTLMVAIEQGDLSHRLLSTRALGAMGNGAKAAVRLLADLLRDPVADVRVAAASALGHIGRDRDWPAGLTFDDELKNLIPYRRPLTGSARAEYAPILHQLMLDRVVPPLIDALVDREASVRSAAASALGRMRDEAATATEALIKVLEDPDPAVRRAGVNALGHVAHRDPAVLDPLGALLTDGDDQVRWSAARVVRAYGGEAVPVLVKVLGADLNGARRLAAETLGDIGSAAAMAREALESALDDEDGEVREAARWALGRLGDS